MLSPDQVKQVSYLSDTILYSEAVAFMDRLVTHGECNPLPTSQVMGLFNVAQTARYDEILYYIQHQRDRDWQPSKRDLKVFYTELEKYFTTMRNKRLASEFHLLQEGVTQLEANRQRDELMAALAPEFLQHLLAENGLLALASQGPRRY